MADLTLDEELPDALDGQRVDRVVSLLAGLSRSAATALVAAGRVTLDGAVVERPSVRVASGARLLVTLDVVDHSLVPDPSVPVALVHVDDDVVVVDKPAGLIVHPGAGAPTGTLVQGLLARFPDMAGVGPPDRPGIVHRLDKGTSGLLMVARTAVALESLSAQLQVHTVDREYRTLVWGEVEAERGVIDAPWAGRPAMPCGGRWWPRAGPPVPTTRCSAATFSPVPTGIPGPSANSGAGSKRAGPTRSGPT